MTQGSHHRHYRVQVLVACCLLALGLSAGLCPDAAADIYVFRDAQGVLHFTNTPSSNRYKVFLKSTRRAPSGRTDAYDSYIEEASLQHGVDFPLIKAVIRAESAFNHKAVSVKGARGLMQIMPSNFEMLQLHNPYDPRENIMAGTRYLRQMLDRFNGKLGLSLAAYNCGPTMVERYQCVPPIDETLNYVEKVLRYYQQYQASR
jgi:soluble lytic murein transglycosylase